MWPINRRQIGNLGSVRSVSHRADPRDVITAVGVVFFLLTFVIKDIASEFHAKPSEVSFAVMLTLMARPIGAFIFGRLADRWSRTDEKAACGLKR